MMPALMGSASAASPTPQAGPDPSGAMNDLLGTIRQIGTQVDQLGAANPALAPIAAQIKTLLRQAIVAAAQQASAQTPSSDAVPMAGQ